MENRIEKLYKPEESLTLENFMEILPHLKLVDECIDCSMEDINDIKEGKVIQAGLDFSEIQPLLFPLIPSEEAFFTEIDRIWKGIFSLKQNNPDNFKNINFVLLPGTILEFFSHLHMRYSALERVTEAKYERMLRFIENIEKLPTRKFWEKLIEKKSLVELLAILEGKSIEDITVEPIKKLIKLYDEKMILPMEEIPEINEAMKKVVITNPETTSAYSVLNLARPNKTPSNIIDTYNIIFSTGINNNFLNRKKNRLVFFSTGVITRLAARRFSKEQLEKRFLPLERHPLELSYTVNILRNIEIAKAHNFLNESQIPLNISIQEMEQNEEIKKVLNMDRKSQRDYVRANKDKHVFLSRTAFDAIQFFYSSYIRKMQSIYDSEQEDALAKVLAIDARKVVNSVLDWRKTKERKKDLIIEGDRFKKQIYKLIGDNYENFLPVKDLRFKDILAWIKH